MIRVVYRWTPNSPKTHYEWFAVEQPITTLLKKHKDKIAAQECFDVTVSRRSTYESMGQNGR